MLGILGDKAVDEIIGVIVPLATAEVIVTTPNNPRAADPHLLDVMVKTYRRNVPDRVIVIIPDAVAEAVAATKAGEALCVSGSLYTISEAREILKKLYPQQA